VLTLVPNYACIMNGNQQTFFLQGFEANVHLMIASLHSAWE